MLGTSYSSSLNDNIWGVYLADMQLKIKYNIGIRYLLCVIDLFSRYASTVPLKNKKGATFVNGFQRIQKENQIKYGFIKVVNFTTIILENC